MEKGDGGGQPDYGQAAKDQGRENRMTALFNTYLSNPLVTNPFGSRKITFNPIKPVTGKNEDGTPIYDTNEDNWKWTPSLEDSLTPEAQARLDQQNRISTGMGNLSEFTLMPQLQKALGTEFNTHDPNVNLGYGVGRVNQERPFDYGFKRNYESGGQILKTFGDAGPIQTKIPGADDLSADRLRVEDALYSRVNPQLQRDRESMEQRLANQGLAPGGEAYARAMDEVGRKENDARMQVITAGGNEQSRLFGLGLASGQFNNEGQQQLYDQILGRSQFNNAAQAQQEQQNRAAAGFYNEGLTNFNNTIGQQVNSDLARGTFENKSRDQLIQEALLNRSQPINELMALRNGSPIQFPTFGPWQGANANPANYQQAAAQQGQQATNAGNQSSSTMNSLIGAAGTALGAYFMAGSDRRLKSNIQRVGTHPLGIGIYEYDIFGHRERGVMAQELQEVMPEAVGVHPTKGYLMVAYDMIGGRP